MDYIRLSTAVLALFRQDMTRTGIARELRISVEEIDQIMEIYIFQDDSLPFLFRDKLKLLLSPIVSISFNQKRIYTSMKNKKVIYVWELARLSKETLLSMRNFGESSLAEVDRFLIKDLCGENPSISFYQLYPEGLSFSKHHVEFLKKESYGS